MRSWHIVLVLVGGMALGGCSRTDEVKTDEAARRAGREAYEASRDVKRDAKEAEERLRKAGKDFRDGWNEAKRKDPPRREDR